MAKKHLKNNISVPQEPEAEPQGRHAAPQAQTQAEPRGRHAAPDPDAGPAEPSGGAGRKRASQAPKAKKAAKAPKSKKKKTDAAADDQAVAAVLQALTGDSPAPAGSGPVPVPEPAPAPDEAGGEKPASPDRKKAVVFRRARAKRAPKEKKGSLLSRRDAVGAVISLTAALVLLAATLVIWLYRDSFSPDGLILSADTSAVAKDEYVFDAGSGEAFAAAGQGLAVANTSGLELLDSSGTPVTSMVMQMENPTAAGCSQFAVFYDLGGRRLAVARFDGTVEELTVRGNILSATVSSGGYTAVTTEATGYRALVTDVRRRETVPERLHR